MDNQLASAVRDRREDMFSFLEEMVRIQSGTRHKAGVDRVGRMIRERVGRLPVDVEVVHQSDLGNHLIVRTRAAGIGGEQMLLVGHMDTVFPENTAFNWYREDVEHSYGPGVIDMKGGLVAGIFAMEALHRTGALDRLPLAFLFNTDEEIGSPTSRALIQKEAALSRCAFVLEAGGLDGGVVTGRKGNMSLRLTHSGTAGHAAFAGTDKASAIADMAHRILALEALNQPDRGISVNVGDVHGGIGPNTVAESAVSRVDVRFVEKSDGERLANTIDNIAAEPVAAGTSCTVETVSRRPPMPATAANRMLFDIFTDLAVDMEIPITEEFRHGVSDANIIADAGVPVLDGLGPIGARDHSDKEYMVKESLVERTLLLAAALPQCWDRFASASAR